MASLQDDNVFAQEAEQSIVAALFSDAATSAEVFDRVNVILKGSDFFFPHHKLVFCAYAELIETGIAPDAVTLATYIKSGATYDETVLASITAATTAPFAVQNIEAYAHAIVEKSRARQIRMRVDAIGRKAKRVGGDISSADLLREVESIAMDFDDAGHQENQLLQSPMALLAKAVDRMDAMQSNDLVGARTGIDRLDERLGPLVPGYLVVVAGRPSMGKTALAIEIAVENNIRALADDQVANITAIFSIEMSEEQLAFRFLSNIGAINHDHVRKGKLNDDEWTRMSYAFKKYEHSNIRVDCAPTLTPAMMRSKLRTMVRVLKQPIGLIVVDYLQLMDGDKVYENRNAEITAITRALKRIAKEFGCPVIAVSQLNRGVENRADKRPMMSDLRESGAIEQDADVIILLYRDEYYNPNSEAVGIVELNAAKARDGGIGIVAAQWIGEHQRFRNLNTSSHSYDTKYREQE